MGNDDLWDIAKRPSPRTTVMKVAGEAMDVDLLGRPRVYGVPWINVGHEVLRVTTISVRDGTTVLTVERGRGWTSERRVRDDAPLLAEVANGG